MDENIEVIEVQIPLEGQFAIHTTGLEIESMDREELIDFAKSVHTSLVAERYLTKIMLENDPALIFKNIEDNCSEERLSLQEFLDYLDGYDEYICDVIPESAIDQIRSCLAMFDTIRTCCNRARLNIEVDG